MMPDLLHRFRQSHAVAKLLPPGTRVLAAVSGGPDSVALARLLHGWGCLAGIAHVDHGLRVESVEEAALVEELAERLGVAFHVTRLDPTALKQPGDSLQARARSARYAFLEALLATGAYDRCATAHHADDQAETVLIQLIRGNDPRPLMPIPAQRDAIVRPLLEFSKAELEAYCVAEGLAFATDPSNADLHYLRNEIRHVALPALASLNPRIGDRLRALGAAAAQAAAWEERWWPLVAREVLHQQDGGELFRLVDCLHLPWAPPLEMALGAWLRRLGWHGNELLAALALVHAQVGAQADMEAGRLTRTHAGFLWTVEKEEGFAPVQVEAQDQTVRVGDWEVSMTRTRTWHFPQGVEEAGRVFYMDARVVTFPLVLRPWQHGDRMRPFGKGGLKKLSDIFIDAHWTPQQKQRALVIATPHGQVLALSGFRIADFVRIEADTTEVWCIRLRDLGESLSPAPDNLQDTHVEF